MTNKIYAPTAIVTKLVQFMVGASLIMLVSVPRGYNIDLILLTLLAIIILPILGFKRQLPILQKDDKQLIITFLVYGLLLMSISLYHSDPASFYGRGGRFIAGIFIFLLLYKYPFKPISFFSLILLTTFLATSLGYYNHINYTWASRATIAKMNTNHYAEIVQILAFINLIGIMLAKQIKPKWLSYLYIVLSILAFFAGICMSFLSGSRGAWLALPIQLLVVFVFYYKYNKKNAISFSILVIFLIWVIYIIPQTEVKQRIDLAFNSFENYKQGQLYSNTGLRLGLYNLALEVWKRNPILGASKQKINTTIQEMIETHKIHWHIADLKHFHSLYFENLAHYGIVGLLALAFLFYSLLKSFWIRFSYDDIITHAAGATGLIVILTHIVVNLVDRHLSHSAGFCLFIIIISLAASWGKMPHDLDN